MSPVMVVGPVLVMPDPASTAKLSAVPNPMAETACELPPMRTNAPKTVTAAQIPTAAPVTRPEVRPKNLFRVFIKLPLPAKLQAVRAVAGFLTAESRQRMLA